MIYGYARVSTKMQDFNGQVETLKKEGCETIYHEKFTGTKADRPEFTKVLNALKEGDTLKVTKLDRLARNTREGIDITQDLLSRGVKVHILNVGYIDNTPMGRFFVQTLLAVAELERNMIVERTQEGKEIAKRNPDFREGRPKTYNKKQIEHALELKEKGMTYKQAEEMTGISKSTIIRAKRKKQAKDVV